MTTNIHPTAVVDGSAVLADGVVVGPLAVIGAGVTLGEDTEVCAGGHVQGPAVLGRENVVSTGAFVGFPPQDLKYRGEETWLRVGDRNRFREASTVHRGTEHGGRVTEIGDDNLFMAYTHVAHDCRVGSRTVFANGATLAGHVEVQDDATISAFSSVHQFCRIGRHAYVGGYSVIVQDVMPFTKVVGIKTAFYGLNRIGLERKGMAAESIEALGRAIRRLTRGGVNVTQAVEELRSELGDDPEVTYLLDFVGTARRGVVRGLPGRKGSRGGG